MMSIASITGICAILYTLFEYFIRPVYISSLAKIPNAHWSSSFNPLYMLWIRYQEKENRTIHRAHVKHGKIVRLGPREVSINSVDDGIRIVYGGGFEKWEWYPNQFDNYGVACAFSMADSKPHSIRKRMVSNVYSKSYLQSSKDLQKISTIMIYERLQPILGRLADTAEVIDVLEFNFAIVMDFVNAFIFGLGNGSNFLQDEKTRSQWLRTYQSRRPFRFWDGELPSANGLASKFGFPFVPAWVGDATAFIQDWTLERCRAAATWTESIRHDTNSANVTPAIVYDQLNAAVENNTSESKDLGPPELQVASELLDHLAAGHETSGITLTYLFWELSRNISLQDALRQECSKLSPSIDVPKSPTSQGVLPSPRSIDSQPLLHAILMETLRIHAAIPGPQPRITPSPRVSVAGSPPLEAGIRISAQPYSLHRNASVFPDPEVWRPARWLDANDAQKAEMMKWFWAFGSGGRMCIGSHFAMQEMKLITAAIYSNFTTHIVDDTGIEQVDAYTAGPRSGKLMLRFERVM